MKKFIVMKKDILKIVIKVLIYALGLIASYLGVSAMASCSVTHEMNHRGVGYVQYYDTILVNGSNSFHHVK